MAMDKGSDGEISTTIRPLHLLTTEILLVDLISGRDISTNEGHSLTVETDWARSVLNWYRNNRNKWAGKLMTNDCEMIVDAIASAPPTLAAPLSASSPTVRRLKLAKLVAHRFAGLHAYGTADSAPDDFVFEPEKPITVFEGWNGSGKTSLANAIIWCLTGQLLRPQRLPEGGDRDFDCVINRDSDSDPMTKHAISPVTPLPHANDWMPDASAETIPADTWVELTFADADGNLLPPVRRTQTRKKNGKLDEKGPEPAILGVEPVAFRLGTLMPGILPFLQIGSSSELGVAIAKLTGLADLVELSRHAEKASKKIAGDITNERKNELDRIDAGFVEHRGDLETRLEEFPAMKPADILPNAGDENAAEVVTRLQNHFGKLKAEGLADAREVLGDYFDPEVASQCKDLEENIGPAIEQLRKVGTLPSMERIGKLALDAKATAQACCLLNKMRTEALTLSELADNPTLARRTQLYARVATWMTQQGEIQEDHCAVCRHSLAGVIDPDTGTAITEHLRQVRDDGDLIAQTIVQWMDQWSGRLARDLPEVLRGELARDLPECPSGLLSKGFKEELFATDGFSGALRALQPLAAKLVEAATSALPPFEEPEIEALPEKVVAKTDKLATMIVRVERALAFSDWMAANPDVLRSTLEKVSNGSGNNSGDGRGASETQDYAASIGGSLGRLEEVVKGVAPISAAITLTDRLDASLKLRQMKLSRIEACGQCAKALEEIVPVGLLAQEQVEGLRCQLHDRAEYWRDQIYQNATTFAPKPQTSGMNAQGVIDIHVGRGVVRAPAQHVSNASALRASLMAFYLAFLERVLKTSGGLTILVLDDPQDLLDYDNRQRLARAITQLANDGIQIVATTHDRSFARTLAQEARPADLIAHRSVHPVNTSRATIETALAIDELDRKRQLFDANPDIASYAQDYVNEARIFIEARLGDLFDDPAYPAHSAPTKAPTLGPLFDRLRALVNGRSNELFRSPVLNDFCRDPAMADGANARRVLNSSHHDKSSISYADVERIDDDLRRLRASVERVHGEFRRYRWREPLAETPPTNVVVLTPVKTPTFSIPVCEDIAAFTGHIPSEGSQVIECDVLLSSWFDDKALFYIKHDTMGFAIPVGSVAIVEAESSSARDHSLVVARRGKQAYARRLLRPRNGEGFSLAAEATDPRKSRPTLAFEDHGIDVHRVVGVLLSHMSPPEGREEAIEIESDPILTKVEVAYRVREESAVPLALPGQTILGGKVLTVTELSALEGHVVAVTLDDGTSILKRVGSQVTAALPYLRLFETIGSLGESVVIATEEIDGAPSMPVMAYARPIIGVIYGR